MSKGSVGLEALLTSAGVDVAAAKAGLEQLDSMFAGEAGDIPEGALSPWVNQHFAGKERAVFIALARAWEAGIELPADRKWEKEPGAAAIKAKRNLKKAEK